MADGGSTSGDVLLCALEDLTKADFKRVKDKLPEISFKGCQSISRGKLEKADQIDTKNLLVQFYGLDAIDVTIKVFTKVGLKEPAAKLREGQQRVVDPHEAREVSGPASDFRRRYMEHIVEHYRRIKDRNAWPGETVPLQKRYTKLLIVQKYRYEEERQHEIMSHGRKHISIMDRLAYSEHYIGLDALFDSMEDGRKPRTVVLQGPAGIGKTMTAQKIMLDWALGNLYQGLFDYVFYLSCREINQVRSHKSVFDLIAAGCPDRTIPASALAVDPSKILFILDGFDELTFSLDLQEDQHCSDPCQKNPVEVTLSNLLRRNIPQGCALIITTRLTALARLMKCIKDYLCAEIMGFTEEDRKLYFSGFFDNNEQASRALAVVKDNDTLYTMCFLPIVCWIVCTVIKQQMKGGQVITNSSKNTTSVYLFFLSSLLRGHSDASAETMQRSLMKLCSLKRLCSLALNGIFEQRILFNEKELRQIGLEVSDIQSLFLNQNIFQKDIDVYSAYSFIHLSFQEFFAALFYILDLDVGSPNPPRDLKHLLKEYSEHARGHLKLTVQFLCGLINKDQMRHVEEVLGYKISPSVRADLIAWLQEPKEESLLMDVFHCLHETQDEEIISSTMKNIQNINITWSNYRMIDFKVLSLCLKHCQGDKTLNLSGINFRSEHQEIMRAGIINCDTLRLNLCQMFGWWIRARTPLTYALGEVKPKPEPEPEADISVLCEALRNPGCRVRELSLRGCGLTSASCAALAAILRSNRSLLELDLGGNNLGDAGVSLICDALKEPDSRLQKICLSHCEITGASCAALVAALRSNRSLLDLDLRGNALGDAGTSLLCDALKHPDTRLQKNTAARGVFRDLFRACLITFLSLSEFLISGASCAALPTALRCSRSLLELKLTRNRLGDAGATLISDALKHPDTRLLKITW